MDIQFLKSERFWAIVINAAVLYLQQKGYIGREELALVTAIIGPFVVVGTIDRVGKNIGGVTPPVTDLEDKKQS